jgi:type II secretory pathway pseudopilin PulG
LRHHRLSFTERIASMTRDAASFDLPLSSAARRTARDKRIAVGIVAGAVCAAIAASVFAMIAPSLPKARDSRAEATDALSQRWALESALDLQAAVDGAAHAAQRADTAALVAAETLARARLLAVQRPVNVAQLTLPNGAIYVGEVTDGVPQGVGLARSPSGAFTAGAYAQGVRTGPGVECVRDDCATASYFGDFRDGRPSGLGRIRSADGAVFRGDVRDGAPSGFGELRRPDGSSFAGGFTSGRRDGYGVDRAPDGAPTAGYWANDEFAASTQTR